MLLPAVRLRHSNESRQEAEKRSRRRQPAKQSPSALRGAGQRRRQRGQGHFVCSLQDFLINIEEKMFRSVLRFRDVYPGSQIRIFPSRIQDTNFFQPGSRIRIKEFKYFNPKSRFQAFGNMSQVVHPVSGS
jgi:hypothetical protein